MRTKAGPGWLALAVMVFLPPATVLTEVASASEARFGAKPRASAEGGKVKITFTLSVPTDVVVDGDQGQ